MSRGNWQTWRKGTTGFYVPYTEVENHVSTHMTNLGADKAQAAIIYDNKLVAIRNFNCESNQKFRIASVSKLLTGSAINKIIAAGTGGVTLNTLVAAYLGYNAPADSRASSITVNHLLQHQGGWNSSVSPDHVFNNRNIATTLGVTSPPTDAQLVQYAINVQTLDFAPGAETHYANIGYITLGEVVRVATGMSYHKYVLDMLATMNISAIRGYALEQNPYEPAYLNSEGTTNSVYGTAPGATVQWPYGGFGIENMTAGGGWVMRIADLAFYTYAMFDGTIPQPKQDPSPLIPLNDWSKAEGGSMPGTYTMSSRHWDGTHLRSCLAFFNKRTGAASDDDIAGQLLTDANLMV